MCVCITLVILLTVLSLLKYNYTCMIIIIGYEFSITIIALFRVKEGGVDSTIKWLEG